MISWSSAVVVLLAAAAAATNQTGSSDGAQAGQARLGPSTRVYTNQFVIQVRGGEPEARRVAERHGFVYLNHILADYYHLEHRRLSKRSLSATPDALNISIESEPQVLLLERQVLKRRVKRDFLDLGPPPPQVQAAHAQQPLVRPANQRVSGAHQLLRPARPPNQPPAFTRPAAHELLEAAASQAPAAHHPPLPNRRPPLNGSQPARTAPFNDPSWPLMWYLDGGAKNGFDLNVMAAWKMGYTGKGIVITILDDGLEKDHPDLQANYDPLASFDINGDDADPMPRYDVNDSNRHGTRCAGEVAAVPDNNICSIGIAYNSKVGGVRMLDGDVTDAVEARSLGLNNQHIHIYSASWGPDDNGKTVDGPGEMATRAFIEGVTNGRQGLGSIFVFASGNGGREHDNCNCDGYTNSIWTLSISSATENGYVPWYIEACSSTLATTYSSGSYEERQIATTDLHHSCTSSHTGTSASAPLAAGICALVLESNPRLTWRDMQHIVVRTAKPANLVAKDWRTNAMGRNVSHAFGYGLMDAAAMIHLARRWATVPVQYTCEVRSPQMEKFIPAKGYIELKLRAECANVRHLEHVQSKVTLTSQRRGDLHIYLVSPHGTRSTLLAQRPNDQAEQGFRNWPFMTVHSWGESPNGIWTLEVHNDGKPQNRAYLKEWTLILYGTYDDPNRHLDGPTPAPPAPEPPYPAHVSARPSAPAVSPPSILKAPVSAPPPPLPALPGNHFEAPGSSESAGGSTLAPPGRHWTFTAPPPPPPETDHPTRAPPPTTSTSTYVTTFKTIVSTSSLPPPQQPSRPTAPATTSTTSSSTTSTSTSAPATPESTKADFEVVLAPGSSSPPPPADSRLRPAPEQAPPAPATTPAPPPLKPPVSADSSTDPSAQAPDNNQIDSKLSKDYRSSGDATPSREDKLGRPSAAAAANSAPSLLALLLLLTLSLLANGGSFPTTPGARPRIVRSRTGA